MKKFISRYKRFGKYVAVSGVTTVVNVVSYMIFLYLSRDMYVLSNVLSWIISIFITFFLNKRVVFKAESDRKRDVFKELVLFYLVRLSSLLIDTIVLMFCVKVLKLGDVWAKIIANVSTTFNNYFISKHFVFKNGMRASENNEQ